MSRIARAAATVATAGALAVLPAAPGFAQGPVVTGGLVNVTVTNLLNNNTVTVQVPVGVALNVAANVCGVAVNVLATQLGTGTVSCTNNTSSQSVDIGPISA